ncbi:MAG: helix-turn-helix domain-containing protein [Gaiellaceae bacterium]
MPDDDAQPGDTRTLTGREVRALAHPLRIRMLESLREEAATASILARRLNESTGATSYHLRELARHGFIEEDLERGTARERWWRRRERILLVAPKVGQEPETDAAYARLQSIFLDRDAAALERWVRIEPSVRWQEAAMIGNWGIHATPEEVEELTEKVVALVDELRRAPGEAPADAKLVHVSFRALPQEE